MRAAAHNNAVWCDAVSSALGGETAFGNGLWVNRQQAPPYYSNAVTLNPDDTDGQSAGIRALLDAGLSGKWTVKDSFCTLDLTPLGFRVLFEAQWLTLATEKPMRTPDARSAHWERITTEGGLAEWETAWRRHSANMDASSVPRIFMPRLVADLNVAFLCGHLDAQVVAVAAANFSDDGTGRVCGLSNVFVPSQDAEAHRIGALALARACFPGLSLVGYARGNDLVAMRALGFQVLGPLRVWIRELHNG
jgi:hypothetical protein